MPLLKDNKIYSGQEAQTIAVYVFKGQYAKIRLILIPAYICRGSLRIQGTQDCEGNSKQNNS
jgi:hypothetical protein